MNTENKPDRNYKVIRDEIDRLLAQRDAVYINIGERLCELRGPKHVHRKQNQKWRQDPEAIGVSNFTNYCTLVWGHEMDTASVYRYIKAYEVYVNIKDDDEMPSNERAMRPITTLKSKKDQESALQWARAYKKREGAERLTAVHTTQGVKAVQLMKQGHKADHQRIERQVAKTISSEGQLRCYAEHGIGYVDVMNEFKSHWNALLKTLKPMSALTDEELTKTVAKWVGEFLNTLLKP